MPMDLPTADDVQAWSEVDFAALGYDDNDMDRMVARAIAYVEQWTWRIPLTDVPDGLVPIAQQAVQLRVEQLAVTGTESATTQQTTDDGIQSFTVPGYSETRFDRGSSSSSSKAMRNEWDALWELLWLLMTPEAREAWIAQSSGENVDIPAFDVTEVDWSRTGWGDVPWTWNDPTDPPWEYPSSVRTLGDW